MPTDPAHTPTSLNRRDFLRTGAALSLAALPARAIAAPAPAASPAPAQSDRPYWLTLIDKLSRPILQNLADNTLRKNMPVESNGKNRQQFTHLEAFGRLLVGIAPWLASTPTDPAESKLHADLRALAAAALDNATNPASPDFLNYSKGDQALVDTAFLAEALLRAKSFLWDAQPARVRQQFIAALEASRAIAAPNRNNWVLFAATVEAALLAVGRPTRRDRLEDELRRMLSWYKGDGIYGDGAPIHADYYNSYVIHPMLLDCLATLAQHDPRFEPTHAEVLRRARRYSRILEMQIAPDGTYPPIGRSITYRAGAFHALAAIALAQQLPEEISAAQVRCALTAVLHKTLDVPDTFDQNGWLRIGLAGHQPALGEPYISTGSLYMCSVALLPLALPPSDNFWADPPAPWSQQKLWKGENMPADHALPDAPAASLPLPTLPDLQ
ncbi:MAG TPA: DUF2264 domain-containing protein [Phycisphaerae bacterium]|nr:DUF2264 domain-containing protein [Phycisphaerae bacterium]